MSGAHAVLATYGVLALAVLSLWVGPGKGVQAWPFVLAAATAIGWASHLITPIGALLLLAFAVLCYATERQASGGFKTFLYFLVGFGALAISLHKFGGFVNPSVVRNVQFSPDSPAFTPRLNFDTAAAGVILCGVFCRRSLQWAGLRAKWMWIIGPALLINALAVAIGYARIDVKWVAYTPLFFAVNLLFTCVTEEAFFRGFIQEKISARWGPMVGLLLASVLFGLAHFKGGSALMGLAMVAGLGYGLAYQKTGRIEGAILAHFMLNALHFVLLSYPRLS